MNPSPLVDAMRYSRVLVAGAGVAGRGVISMLCALAGVDSPEQRDGLIIADDSSELATVTVAQAQELLAGTNPPELIITSPGWAPSSPLLAQAMQQGIPVIGDIEAAWLADQAEAFGPARQWLAVTGTNGKTTTTAMLASMLVADGRAAVAVGNIGLSPAVALTTQLRDEPRVDVLVAEVSSFQLHWAPTFTPTVGCVLNLAEDHLDWHGGFAAYADAKAAVLRAEHPVVAVDDPVARHLDRRPGSHAAYTLGDPAQLLGGECTSAVGVQDAMIVEASAAPNGDCRIEPLASAEGISPPGPAGVADAAAAAAMARQIGVHPAAIAQSLSTFQVQAHRGQIVLEHNGVQWIDNSKATNPHAAQAALEGLSNVIWIAGGQLKGASVTDLIAAVKPSLSAVIALGQDRKDIAGEMQRQAPDVPCVTVNLTDPHAAMQEVVRLAVGLAQPGDVVVLAPAAASLDMYTGMSQRGDLFAQYATNITANDQAQDS